MESLFQCSNTIYSKGILTHSVHVVSVVLCQMKVVHQRKILAPEHLPLPSQIGVLPRIAGTVSLPLSSSLA